MGVETRIELSGRGVLYDALAGELRAGCPPPDAGRDGCGAVVTAHDFPDQGRDQAVQRRLAERGVHWLPVWADHQEVWAGPWIAPGGAPCIACVAARTLAPELLAGRGAGRPAAAPAFLPAWLARLLAAIVAGEAARGPDGLLRGRALVWSLATLRTELHAVGRMPGCPACRPGAGDSPDGARRAFGSLMAPPGGGDSPGAGDGPPLDRMAAALVSPRTGLVRGVTLAGGTVPLAVGELVVAGPTGRRLVLSAGRGTTTDEARRIALFEALERHAGLAPGGRRPAVRASYRALREVALDPRTLVLHAPEQYDAPGFPYHRFDEDRELTWVWGYGLRDQRPVAVPASAVYYGAWAGERLACDTSNGCALGRTVAEAVARALLEVMERDGFLMAWYARRAGAPLDLGAARDWRLVLLARRLERLGHALLAWDVTRDLGVPVVWVMAVADRPGLPRTFSSAGCHPDPEVAAWSALVEVAAGLPDLARRYGRERERAAAMWSDPGAVRTMDDHGLLFAAPEAGGRLAFLLGDRRDRVPLRERAGAPAWWRDRTWPERARCLAGAVLAAGLDAVAVDQTTPEQAAMGLVAVRVLVPGALPMTFGHDSRRLEGADRLTRLLRSAGAEEANPWPHPFP